MSNSIGDLKNSGLQGNNFPWQLKMLEGLQLIYDEVKKPLTCAEDSVALCSPAGGLPVIIDCNDRISLCVNGNIVNAANALPVTVTNPLPLEVNINQANDSILIYGFDGTNNQPVSVGTNGYVNVNANVTFPASLAVTQDPASNPWTVTGTVALDTATLAALETITVNQGTSPWTISGTVALDAATLAALETINVVQSGTWTVGISSLPAITGTVALDAATLAALETVTVNQGTSPWVVSGSVNIGTMPEVEIKNDSGNPIPVTGTVTITDGAGPITVDATALDIRALSCNDKVTLCSEGSPVGLTNQLPVGLYADDLVSTAPERLTTTGGPTYQALDVNQVSFVRTPNIINGIASGTITVPVYSITFFNAGPSNEVIYFDGGVTQFLIPPGVSISMDAGGNNTYPANVFAYDVINDGPIIITYNS